MAMPYPIDIGHREQLRHRHVINALASELQLPFGEVAAQYESMLNALSSTAKVKDYLPVLIAKRIRLQHKTSVQYWHGKEVALNGRTN